jgi:hypothetical protein
MTTPQGPAPRVMFELHGDPGPGGGVYANTLAVWHTPHEFTLDFIVTANPPQPVQTEEGETVIRAPHQLVARVRIPPSVAFDVIRAINENMTHYENRFGPIRRVGQNDTPLYPPDDVGNTGNEPS